jgi:hypothetical protein
LHNSHYSVVQCVQTALEETRAALRKDLAENRVLRIFLSSPFGGMEYERETLVSKFMPQLRNRCERAGVHFAFVDLRWGITEDEAKASKLIEICLREIDRSNVFFGFYGLRYGSVDLGTPETRWVADNIDYAAQFPEYAWLRQWSRRSITELEFRCGTLNNPTKRPSFFFFRNEEFDRRLANEMKVAQRTAEAARYCNEDDDGDLRLRRLKREVHSLAAHGLCVAENYDSPADGAERMFKHFMAFIESVLPTPRNASAEEEETAAHDALILLRRRAFVPDPLQFTRISQLVLQQLSRADSSAVPVVLCGESGLGKTGILANWTHAVRRRALGRPMGLHCVESASSAIRSALDALVADPRHFILFHHFVGVTTESSSLHAMLCRLVMSVSHAGGDSAEERHSLQERAKDLTLLIGSLVSEVLKRVQSRGFRVVLLVDAVDKLVIDAAAESSSQMRAAACGSAGMPCWVPHGDALPPGVVFILSTAPGDCLTRLKSMGSSVEHLEHLDIWQRKEIVTTCLREASKSDLPGESMDRVVANPLSANPLYLRLLIEELIQHGDYFTLNQKINELAACVSVPTLLNNVLARIERTFNGCSAHFEAGGGVVPRVLRLLHLSHRGLAEEEMMDILDLPTHEWAMLLHLISPFLIQSSGLYSFVFAHFHTAVEMRYGASRELFASDHTDMTAFFERQWKKNPDVRTNRRVLDEIPFQHVRSGRSENMINLLRLSEQSADLRRHMRFPGEALRIAHRAVLEPEMRSLAMLLADNDSITDLSLVRVELTVAKLRALIPGLRSNRIQRLEIEEKQMEPTLAVGLADCLAQLPGLRELHVRTSRLSAAAVSVLVKPLLAAKNLRLLDLRGCCMMMAGVVALNRLLVATSAHLEVLRLDDNLLGPEGFRVLSTGLRGCRVLSELGLSQNRLGAAGAAQLPMLLGSTSGLCRLDLTSNMLGEAAASALMSAVATVSASLEEMRVSFGNSISAEMLQGLREGCRAAGKAADVVV